MNVRFRKGDFENMNYRIKSIKHSGRKGERGLSRTDGRYPQRVGRIVKININDLTIGVPLILDYVKDENGNDYSNFYLRCSIINEIHIVSNSLFCVETNNTIYEFERVESEE